ncbi:peroxiredoxin [Pseudomonadota bacterium AL_CKDN230030165-1A_HGKHYDSX7]
MLRGVALSAALTALTVSGVAHAELPAGAKAPTFSTEAALAGKQFRYELSQALRDGPVVLYFYPAAFTQGCSLEARAFAEAIDQYKALGASVVGVSGDDIQTLQKFSVSECGGKFPVAAGTPDIIKAYEVTSSRDPARSKRTSYVISPKGEIVYSHTDSNFEHHVTNTLKALQDWKAKSSS